MNFGMSALATVVFLGITVQSARAQESAPRQVADSVELRSLVFSRPGFTLAHPALIEAPELSGMPLMQEYPTTYLGYALLSTPSSQETRPELTWQMTLSPQKRDPLQTIRMMVGAAEAGGAAYLAYKHIKKYGFLK